MCGICVGMCVILTWMCLCACGGWRLTLCAICFSIPWGRVFYLIAELPDLAHLGPHFPPGIPSSTSHVLQLQVGHLAYWHIRAGGSKVWSSCLCACTLFIEPCSHCTWMHVPRYKCQCMHVSQRSMSRALHFHSLIYFLERLYHGGWT